MAGFLTRPDYRSKNWPSAVCIEHHKNKALVWHPLEETLDGETVKLYADAEDVLSHLPKLGVPQAYRGYAKETMMRALAATRKRHAHLLAKGARSADC